jgi:SpoVK/Ycf46/Vps4 family AAA+-type ATPase
MNKITVLEEMLRLDPNNANVWYLLGLEYLESDSTDKALHAFSMSLQTCNEELKIQISEKITGISKVDLPAEDSNNDDEDEYEYDDEDSTDETNRFEVIPGNKKEKVIDLRQKFAERITFADVGGLDDLKETILMKIVKPFIYPTLFSKFKKKTGGGILLYGPPGCGKTFIAKATSGECQAKFIPIHITDIIDPYIGVSEKNIADIFSSARQQAPSVLFLDEIDAIGFHRGKGSSEHRRSIVDQLLAEMEGIDTSTDKLLIIGATNMPWDVDPAFKRPGRFDKLIFVPPPDKLAREVIFKLKLAEKPLHHDINYELLAAKTEFYSGADIENVVELSTETVITEIMRSGIERPIMLKDLLEAINNSSPSTLEWLRTIKNYVKYANQSGLYNDVDKYLEKHKKL